MHVYLLPPSATWPDPNRVFLSGEERGWERGCWALWLLSLATCLNLLFLEFCTYPLLFYHILITHKARISKARHAFALLRPVWRTTSLSLKTKLRIFSSNVKSVLLYGSETWRLTSTLINKIQVCVNKCLRRILGIRWPERIRNEDL